WRHQPAELVQPGPRGFVVSKSRGALKTGGRRAKFLSHHPPDSPEPNGKRRTRVLENCARSHRCLKPATRAFVQLITQQPGLSVPAARAAEAAWPPELKQKVTAGLLRGEPLAQVAQRMR